MTCPYRIDIAAYLLNALEPDECEHMRTHVPTCPECRPEYDDLHGVTVLLSTLDPADIGTLAEPSVARENPAEPHRRRRNRHRLLAIVVAVVLLSAGLVVAGTQPPAGQAVTVSATDPQTHVHASVTLASRDWGTQIGLQLSGVAFAQHCSLVVSAADGRQETAATWVANYQGTADVAGATAIPTGQIRRLDIVTLSGHELVSVAPSP